jgi:hypothetical protein
MKLLRDPLGRPIQRKYFSVEDLDERCERKSWSSWTAIVAGISFRFLPTILSD